ncbi:carbon storage regulator CsrA [Candidatus Caldatribacterium sp.]|uniref:carbon storage regulator CsrA n=1 Tax=Candidatus Caldatribacterium sp. TaxID=2282143 RepID=UPI002998777C|nr:carbon storage regulator CsrA [Candidatus Caldatribacterium sp.]MDW8081954.1 carbon storage regulator CsrA [Candidatus Calescibacterium sp.]
MLVITRRINESIRIGDSIEVKVVAIERGKVRLGVLAPPDVPIYREELYRSLVEKNKEARFASEEMVHVLKDIFQDTPKE